MRGFRSGFLTETDYGHLARAEDLDDVRQNLADTDYGSFIKDEASALTPRIIERAALERLLSQFNYLRANAEEPLATFLE